MLAQCETKISKLIYLFHELSIQPYHIWILCVELQLWGTCNSLLFHESLSSWSLAFLDCPDNATLIYNQSMRSVAGKAVAIRVPSGVRRAQQELLCSILQQNTLLEEERPKGITKGKQLISSTYFLSNHYIMTSMNNNLINHWLSTWISEKTNPLQNNKQILAMSVYERG